ncbi:hypothetical protein BJ138DRAFT_1017000 [Hygrophoropsis aurantiaca]|uniref:Uncharacterized protein n=1 Tax=Hygrophoropsis aurantiaca TaxID=72124 RepID=A0ACB7ZXX1_9AGAM|nr:hypothetical protein BJ138DRAFT_1017000 [Hygrophoropsis aurantiaca]
MVNSFVDSNAEKMARNEIENLKQNSRPAEEFFIEFEQIARRAGYSVTSPDSNAFICSLIERNINQRIHTMVYQMENVPSTYAEWKRVVIKLDEQQRRLREFNTARNTGAATSQKSAKTGGDGQKTSGSGAGVPATKTSTGTTFGGQGQPMDIDRATARSKGLCFKCGTKWSPQGHVCVSKGMTNRQTTSEWPKSVGGQDLAAVLASLGSAIATIDKKMDARMTKIEDFLNVDRK